VIDWILPHTSQENDYLHPVSSTKGSGRVTFKKGDCRLFFWIGGVERTELGCCPIDLLYGLLNSLFYPFELGLEQSGGSVRMATDVKSGSFLRIALRWASSARPPEQGTEEHCAA